MKYQLEWKVFVTFLSLFSNVMELEVFLMRLRWQFQNLLQHPVSYNDHARCEKLVWILRWIFAYAGARDWYEFYDWILFMEVRGIGMNFKVNFCLWRFIWVLVWVYLYVWMMRVNECYCILKKCLEICLFLDLSMSSHGHFFFLRNSSLVRQEFLAVLCKASTEATDDGYFNVTLDRCRLLRSKQLICLR